MVGEKKIQNSYGQHDDEDDSDHEDGDNKDDDDDDEMRRYPYLLINCKEHVSTLKGGISRKKE